MQKPETPLSRDWEQYMLDLESQIRYFRNPGLESTYHALNFQLNKMSEIIMEADINLDGNDKIFERFWKIATEVKQIAETVSWLKKEVFQDKTETQIKDSKEGKPIIEQLVSKKKNSNAKL